MIDFISI